VFQVYQKRREKVLKMMNISGYLEGHLLLSIPKENQETMMNKGVLLVCKHDAHGAMGFVLNQELDSVFLSEVLPQMDDYVEDESWTELGRVMDDACPSVFWGGPLDGHRTFVVHSLDYRLPSTVVFGEEYGITSDCQVLKQVFASGDHRPEKHIIMLGYAGWKAGQLEKEIQEGMWLVIPATKAQIFDSMDKDLWEEAMQTLGIKEHDLLAAQGYLQ
jgi:putative transcriptional regulator